MKKSRPPHKDDQKKIQNAIDLIYELMETNRQIESTLWMPATVFVLINGFKQSGFTYKEFREEVEAAFEHYKEFFDEN